MKILAKLILIACLSGWFAESLPAQLSPGDLTRAHAALEGISNCTQCHVLGDKVSNEKCLDCHKAIRTRVQQGRGYHVSREVKGKECASCHSEHHGRKFEMVRFDEETFDHKLTGYALTGAHQRIDCRQCHKPDFVDHTDIKNPSTTFLGLDDACLSCHTDQHQGTLSSDCAQCHVTDAFAPASKFDHDRANFALLGKHEDVDCAACHQTEMRNGREFQVFTGLEFANCNACHDDPHTNNLGTNCKACHTENSFTDFSATSRFNHNTTNFPLKGKHKQLDCKTCHTLDATPQTIFQDRLGVAVNDCNTCHDDVHEGKFGLDCASCHNENSFTASINLDAFNHNLTDFALEGRHQTVDCRECHVSESFTEPLPFNTCNACHVDYHEGQFTAANAGKDCASCHDVFGFEYSLFSIADHETTAFPLEGAHMATPCFACHQSDDTWQFASLETECVSCHEDIHAGFIASTFYPDRDCRACHITDTWQKLQFDHSITKFSLEGRHADIGCMDCHGLPEVMTSEKQWSGFAEVSTDCTTCHENVHHDQFAIEGVTDCKRCHGFDGWTADNFDHNTTRFPLEGRHAEIDCAACHKPELVNGEIIIQYKFESFECVVCHF